MRWASKMFQPPLSNRPGFVRHLHMFWRTNISYLICLCRHTHTHALLKLSNSQTMWDDSGKPYTKSSGKYTLEAMKWHKGREVPPMITGGNVSPWYHRLCWPNQAFLWAVGEGIFLILGKTINVKHWPKY